MTGFRGRTRTSGFVLDVPLLGADESIARVLSWWRDDAELFALPDGRWLLRLPSPVEIRAEHAPGLPLADAAETTFPDHGTLVRYRISDLPHVPVAAWLDRDDIQVDELTPLDQPAPDPEQLGQPEIAKPPDLRAAAGVGRRSSKDRRWRRIPLPAWIPSIAIVIIALGIADPAAASSGPFLDLPFIAIALIVGRLLFVRKGWTARVPGRRRSPSSRRGWLAGLTMRSPAAQIVRGRHARYLNRLTDAFEKRNWDDALREAIALNDSSAGSWLRLRLPARRTGELTPTPSAAVGGGSPRYGRTVISHLQDLYKSAAAQLERDGRIEEAAFVLADLLGRPLDTVSLLERHNRSHMAAQLAEGRRLSPDLIVRLWWRAGNRDRAIQIARIQGAFANGIARLQAVDPDAARDLRAAWIDSCRESGDLLGAVEAAWPDPASRHLVTEDIRAGLARGGPLAARLTAYQLAIAPEQAEAAVKSVLEGSSRELFAATLAEVEAGEPAADRMVATATLRALTRDSATPGILPAKSARTIYTKLRQRADPLAAADLKVPAYQHAAPAPLNLTAVEEAGRLPVFDAAALPDGTILVAAGEAGVRLLSSQGRVRARWDMPAHRIVLADHGGTAMLLAARESVADVARLELASRRLRHWATIAVRQVADSYDGGHLIVVDDDGIAVLDAFDARPRVVWRELDPAYTILRLARTPSSCAAVISHQDRVSLWRWDMPGWHLRLRQQLDVQSVSVVASAAGYLRELAMDPAASDPRATLLGSGDAHAQATAAGTATTIEIGLGATRDTRLRATFPDASPDHICLREQAGTVTMWHRDGRVLTATAAGLLASLRTAQ